jgi:hypothetical protein
VFSTSNNEKLRAPPTPRLQRLQLMHETTGEPAEQGLNATFQPGWRHKSAVMSAAKLHLPDVIAGPTINAALLNELCWCKPPFFVFACSQTYPLQRMC